MNVVVSRGPTENDLGDCIKIALLKFTSRIHDFQFGKSDGPLAREQPGMLQPHVGELTLARCRVPLYTTKCRMFSLQMNRVNISLQVNIFQLTAFTYFINPFQKPSHLSHFQDSLYQCLFSSMYTMHVMRLQLI